MRLTPADVHNVAFKKPSIGKRGYDEDEVDAFLDLVEDELSRLIEENNDLTRQNAELTERLAAYDAGDFSQPVPAPVEQAPQVETADEVVVAVEPEPAPEPEQDRVEDPEPVEDLDRIVAPEEQHHLEQDHQAQQAAQQPEVQAAVQQPVQQPRSALPADHHVHAARLLGLAEETAARLTSEAQAEAEAARSAAAAESERLLTDAQNRSEKALSEAQSKAEQIVGDANAKAEATTRDSQLKAEALERESQRKYSETMNELNSQKTTLEKKIDDLRAYEREYRTRLKGWITEQLAQLDESGSATAAAAPAQ